MGTDGAGNDDAPLSHLAREVRERRRRRGAERAESGAGDGDAGAGSAGGGDGDGGVDWDDLFESVETSDVDAESVWETLAADADATDSAATRGVGVGDDPDVVEASVEGDEHVVPKRAYCQQCPHFSAPPEVACGHEGTTVVEVVDADRFRVRDCPVARDAVENDADSR